MNEILNMLAILVYKGVHISKIHGGAGWDLMAAPPWSSHMGGNGAPPPILSLCAGYSNKKGRSI